MKNQFAKIVAVLMVLAMAVSVFGVCASAAEETTDANVVLLGDVNLDGRVSIQDASLIQKALAKIATLDEVQTAAADAFEDGKISIQDASAIQKWLAKFDDANPNIGQPIGGASEDESSKDEATKDESSKDEATKDEPVVDPSTKDEEATKDEETPVDPATKDEATKDEATADETVTISFVDGTSNGWIGNDGAKIYLYDYATETSVLGTVVDDNTWTFEVDAELTTINFFRCQNEFTTDSWNQWTMGVPTRELANTVYTATDNNTGSWS